MQPPHDEEAFAHGFTAEDRRAHGIFFTPAPLVAAVLDRVEALLPSQREVAIIDPACGAGAFLSACRDRFPRARLFGVELSPGSAAIARQRSGALIVEGDALRGGFDAIGARLPRDCFEVWLGNPPYNGTSALLGAPEEIERIRALLPGVSVPRGNSLRDDYAFFLLSAAHRLSTRSGALAFVTNASLIDSYLYASLREVLLQTLKLREVLELGAGAFSGAQVRTCVTVWSAGEGSTTQVQHRQRATGGPFSADQLSLASAFVPNAPDWVLRPESPAAAELDARWRAQGEPLDVAVPVSFAGLKTRFDELLVDEDRERLLTRVESFLRCEPDTLETFALEHRLPERTWKKLRALHASLPPRTELEPARVRRFFRYAGPRHRDGIPEEDRAFCYLDRRLIPRGDHRLQGDYDPHACAQKLVFNVRELPLVATTLEAPGCVHMWRHARFAPLTVPDGAGQERPNLSDRAVLAAQRLGGPWALFRAIARHLNSEEVQQVWAPAYGTRRVVPVPLDALAQGFVAAGKCRGQAGYT